MDYYHYIYTADIVDNPIGALQFAKCYPHYNFRSFAPHKEGGGVLS